MESDVETLAELKKYLETEIEKRMKEVNMLKKFLRVIDDLLVKKSFVRASEMLKGGEVPHMETRKIVSQKTGETLAYMYIEPKRVRIVISENVIVDSRSAPFRSFFVGRVLEPLRRKDVELKKMGKISDEEAFNYDIILDGNIVREIILENYGTGEQLRRLEDKLRWTLETAMKSLRAETRTEDSRYSDYYQEW
ncbi:MAG: hypothetical protein ACTSXJ_04545 [Candidatus Baldrarchaeia archaeon]